jgi:ferrous iron transport protein B
MNKNKAQKIKEIALVGNPNTGKTTIFNALTGLRHSTANYPGVTVEKRAGQMKLSTGEEVSVLDLPGTYSLAPRSLDEEIVRDVLTGVRKDTPPPDLVLVILDANNLERNLYLATQVLELGIPTILILNMWDMAGESGVAVDLEKFAELTGASCVPTVGMRRENIRELKLTIEKELKKSPTFPRPAIDRTGAEVPDLLSPEARYQKIEGILERTMKRVPQKEQTGSEKLDRVLTHRVWGLVVFIGVMWIIFQSIFSWAKVPMEWISHGIEHVSFLAKAWLPAGALQNLVADGIIAGVGNVIVFLPQIFLLFFFIAFFEDTGYMARAVFVLDRIMKMVGLNGKAFLPLLSSFACTVPGVLATRTIADRKDRLATILVAPLMSCSARLPIYTLLIAAFIPDKTIFNLVSLQGFTLLAMYLLSIGAGLGMAALFRKTFLKGNRMPFVFELPPYRFPHFKTILATMWDRGKEFIYRAGSIIFLLSIVLWFLVSYPKDPGAMAKFSADRQATAKTFSGEVLQERLEVIEHEEKDQQLRSSYAGSLGHVIEPAIRPLGFNWEIGIGIVASFAARELLISTLAIAHHVQMGGKGMTAGLIDALQKQRSGETGKLVYTPLVALSLMVFYVLACQCFSTFAIVKRETGSWGWMIFMITYMTGLAWGSSFLVYQSGRLLGFE